MADDGMLVNFVENESYPHVQPKFKGGSWKDRLVAKKVAHHRQLKRVAGKSAQVHSADHALPGDQAAEKSNTNDFPTSRPAKRRKGDGDFVPPSFHATTKVDRQVAPGRTNSQSTSQRREVISSLFSYNPAPQIVLEKTDQDTSTTPAQPTNAPLVDGIDTFTSLGLSPTLAAHLLTKMELKVPTAIQKCSVSQLLKEDSDAFIQSETGSGKTLAYLLPLVQRIMGLTDEQNDGHGSTNGHAAVQRNSGLFAIVLAPTRELCKQISVVLERLLGCAHWIVAGTVIGGEKKKSEKARLRKGINILVATPGRLADHLNNTKVLDISKVRWLVLDEGDRLMDLGFEEEIQKIVRKLDERRKEVTIPHLPAKRTTVLCSATMKMNVQRLGEISLKDAILIKPDAAGEDGLAETTTTKPGEQAFSAPAQLKQSYTVVAAKLRLVTLAAFLKRTFARKGSVMKAIVFLSCADSVDFHFEAFSRTSNTLDDEENQPNGSKVDTSSSPPPAPSPLAAADAQSIRPSPLLSTSPNPPLTLYKLHGSLPQPIRTSIVKSFSSTTTPSLLLATDVASRGLDLPNLDLVIEYDPPFSSNDHLHRVGRTARLGRDGRALIFLLPGREEGYVQVLKHSYRTPAEGTRAVSHTPVNEILKKGFAATSGVVKTNDWEQKATELQLEVERWVLGSPKNMEMARKAFQSHVRAYATHVADERRWFDIKDLHLGHLAKAFGLRDAPGRMNVQGMGGRGSKGRSSGDARKSTSTSTSGGVNGDLGGERRSETHEAARKMREVVRNSKKKMMMMMGGGAAEFNIA